MVANIIQPYPLVWRVLLCLDHSSSFFSVGGYIRKAETAFVSIFCSKWLVVCALSRVWWWLAERGWVIIYFYKEGGIKNHETKSSGPIEKSFDKGMRYSIAIMGFEWFVGSLVWDVWALTKVICIAVKARAVYTDSFSFDEWMQIHSFEQFLNRPISKDL